MPIATSDRETAPTLRELMRVVAMRRLEQGDDVVPEGSIGTIVHVYPRGEAFEVEFAAPVQAVILARRHDLRAA